MPNIYDFNPAGLRVQLKEVGVLVNRTLKTSRAVPVRITRPKPGENGTMSMRMWDQGGAFEIIDWTRIFVDNPRPSPQLYPRFFNGYVRVNPRIDGHLNWAADLDCVDLNWTFKNCPAMPIVKVRIGAAPIWLPRHPYVLGDEIQPYPGNRHKYTCTRSGISGMSQPILPLGAGASLTEPCPWSPGRDVIVGDEFRAVVSNAHKFIVITPGRTDATQPTWDTATGHVTTEAGGGVQYKENGSDAAGPIWQESGSSLVSDITCINDILDIYFPQELFPHTRDDINSLIASVPSIEILESWTADDALNAVAKFAVSEQYAVVYPSWQDDHVYENYDRIEPTVPNGFIYEARVANDQKSGLVEPTWPNITIGQYVLDNNVIWTAIELVGQWESSVQMYMGQRIEPDLPNGFYYDVVDPGVTAALPPGSWTEVLGGITTSGGVAFMCMGRTAVNPFWQWTTPSDNATHDASWDPDMTWRNANTQEGEGIVLFGAAYSDEIEETSLKVHYIDLSVSNDGNNYANAWNVYGQNASFAYVPDDAAIALHKITVARTFIDTSDKGPRTPEECRSKGYQLLSQSIMRKTLNIKATDPIDPAMIQRIGFSRVENALLGLPPDYDWPLTAVDVEVGMEGTVWNIQAGTPPLTTYDDPYAIVPQGPGDIIDVTPPSLVRWFDDPGDPSYWLVEVNNRLHYIHVQWRSGDEADLGWFHIRVKVQNEGIPRNLGFVYWSAQDKLIDNLPYNQEITVYVAAFDRRGNVLRNPHGEPRYSESPTMIITIPIPFAPTDFRIDDEVGYGGFLYPNYGEQYATGFFAWNHAIINGFVQIPDFYRISLLNETTPDSDILLEVSGNTTGVSIPMMRIGDTYKATLWAVTNTQPSIPVETYPPTFVVPSIPVNPPTDLHVDDSRGDLGYEYLNSILARVYIAFTAPDPIPDYYLMWVIPTIGGVIEPDFFEGYTHIPGNQTSALHDIPLFIGQTYRAIIRSYINGQPSSIATMSEFEVPAMFGPAPEVGLITQGYTAGQYYCKITIDQDQDGSGNGGFGLLKPSGHGGIEQIVMIPPNSTFPKTIRFKNLMPQSYDYKFVTVDHVGRPSLPAEGSVVINAIPIKPPPPIWSDNTDEFDVDQGIILEAGKTGGNYALAAGELYAGAPTVRITGGGIGAGDLQGFIPEKYSMVQGERATLMMALKAAPLVGFGANATAVVDIVIFDAAGTELERFNAFTDIPSDTVYTQIKFLSDKTQYPDTAYAMVSVGQLESGEGTWFSKPEFSVPSAIINAVPIPTASAPYIIYDENGDPVMGYYWSPGGHRWTFVPIVNPTYPDPGYSFRDHFGDILEMQGGILTYSGTSAFIGTMTLDSYLRIAEQAAPATPAAGYGSLYFKTDGHVYSKNDGGTEYDLTLGAGSISGSGVANQVALWSGSATLIGDTGMTFDPTTNILTVTGSVVTPFTGFTGTISDAQHGSRGGGSLHAAATGLVAGFMSAANFTKLLGIGAGANVNGTGTTGELAIWLDADTLISDSGVAYDTGLDTLFVPNLSAVGGALTAATLNASSSVTTANLFPILITPTRATKSSTFTVDATASIYICTNGSTITANLPAASGVTNRIYIFKRTGAGLVTIDGSGTETIDGATTYDLSIVGQSVILQCDGTNWQVLNVSGVVTATQHGAQAGGALHANASGLGAGFMTAADFTKLGGIAAGANVNGSGASNLLAFWSDADTITSDADLSYNATSNVLTVGGLFTTGTIVANDVVAPTLMVKAIVDAKGDLIVGTANDTVARFAVGTDGAFPIADSGVTNGLSYTSTAGKNPRIFDNYLYFRTGTDVNHGIRWNNTVPDGPELFGYDGIKFSIMNGVAIIAAINTNGLNLSTGKKILVNGTQVVQARGATFTQTYTTTATTVNAYTTDPETVAYVAPGTLAAAAPLTGANALRVAYENLRASYDNLLNVVTKLIDELQLHGLIG